ncbi:zinc finger protein with KRAB and SCAN domains 1-like [Planococcus citri]|uniref:zinc finger protein with KRAB and SCAN domains 1-like n=1 Tax=Planococcus citri TaxID=170843 RepID=UPI0031F93FA4
MNFSSFATPFSVSTAVNQFSLKFNAGSETSSNGAESLLGANLNVDDANTLLKNAESMAIAVSRYQNSTTPRFNSQAQQNMLTKYYRDSGVQIVDEIPNNMLSTSLISAKLRNTNDSLGGINYESLRNNLQQQLTRHDFAVSKRTLQNNCIRIQNMCNVIKKEDKEDSPSSVCLPNQQSASANLSVASWQSIAAVAAAAAAAPTSASVADYLSAHLPTSSIPLSLHSIFKYSSENVKKEVDVLDSIVNAAAAQNQFQNGSLFNAAASQTMNATKKKKRKKSPKEKKPKPKPGEIRMTTALDGSALYCCPECHMAYPDKTLLEQHLLGHTIERRFFCDICGAGLKRKDHLTRHKQSHNPDRPHACSVCTKAFKRKEQLALHYVIHSGEKRHVCPECGKGFYRKDHLRKHTRSHIARRVKAELSQYVPSAVGSSSSSTQTS